MPVKTKPRPKPRHLMKSIVWPPELFKLIDELATRERRSFSAQVVYLCERALNPEGAERG